MNEHDTNTPSETNLALFDALTDETIDTSDIPPLSETFFEKATWRMPKSYITVSVEIDPEILAWFKQQGSDYQRRLTAALHIYVQAHKNLAG